MADALVRPGELLDERTVGLMLTNHGVTALDVAKRLMDYGFHPTTIDFPLVVPEALMIEPTAARSAPHMRPITRRDEAKAARSPVVRHGFDVQRGFAPRRKGRKG